MTPRRLGATIPHCRRNRIRGRQKMSTDERTPARSPQAGIFQVMAQERIVYGTPAGEAVVAGSERCGAGRVFVTSTRSLAAKSDGPLQRLERALGARHAGTYTAIGSHSPREDVAAGANAARAAGADLMVAVGGGSVIDATKAMLLCLWLGLDSAEAMEPYCSRLRAHEERGAEAAGRPHRACSPSPPRCRPPSSRRVRRRHAIRPPTPSSRSAHPPVGAARGGARSRRRRSIRREWLLVLDRHAAAVDHAVERLLQSRSARPCHRGAGSLQGLKAARPRACRPSKARPRRPWRPAGGAARHVAGDRALRRRRHRPRAPATASAMRWAPPSAFRTATRRA